MFADIIEDDMPEEQYVGESSESTPWRPPSDPDLDAPPAPPKPVLDTMPLSTVALAAAGVGALNLLLTVVCTITWLLNEEMGMAIIAASNGLWLLLGFAGIGLGAYVQRQQKKAGVTGGTAGKIAMTAILSSTCIMSGAVMLPLITAVRSLVAPAG
jgi:hypothetical protein